MNCQRHTTILALFIALVQVACDPSASFLRNGKKFQSSGNYRDAIEQYSTIIHQFPNSPNTNQAKDLIAECRDSIAEKIMQNVKTRLSEKNYPEGIKLINQIQTEYPDSKTIWSLPGLKKECESGIDDIFGGKSFDQLYQLKNAMNEEDFVFQLLMHSQVGQGEIFKKAWPQMKKELFDFRKRNIGDYEVNLRAVMQYRGLPEMPVNGVYYVDVNRFNVITWDGLIVVHYSLGN